jgi:protein-S-isoprenylcysteine O-methyltransferase Ste14
MDWWGSVLYVFFKPFEWIDSKVRPRAERHLVTHGLWSLITIVFSWLTFPILLAWLFIPALAFAAVLGVFWTAPTVVWLSLFHDVPFTDSLTYAVTLANGRPEYEGPFGINNDPSLIGFGLFNLAAWAAVLAPFAVAWFALMWFLDRRELKRIEREFEQRRQSLAAP